MVPKVAFIDLTFNWPPVGGCWIDTLNVMRGLREAGVDVHLFVPYFQAYYPRGRIDSDLPVPVTLVPFNRLSFNFLTVRRRFGAVVGEFQPDLVFLADGYAMKGHLFDIVGPERTILRLYSYELICTNLHYYRYHEDRICDLGFLEHPDECRRCWFRRVPGWVRGLQILFHWPEHHPVLHFSQEVLGAAAFTQAYWRQLRKKLNYLACAIVYNRFIASLLESHVRYVRVIPSGVDTEVFSPTENRSTSDGVSGRPVRVFLPGRANDPLKGLSILQEAVATLRAKGLAVDVHYTAALEGPRPELWMVNHGWVSHEQLPELYRKMDVVAIPSTWIEPFGITAVEAMAIGLPIVASRMGGLAETVSHGETGYHVEPGRPDELADRLEELVRSPERRAEMGQKGRERAESYYDWNRIVEREYLPLIYELLSRRR